MIYAKGEIVHHHLSAEYTDVRQLISTLRSNGFAGLVEVEMAGRKGYFLIASGKIINAVIESDNGQGGTMGKEAMEKLFTAASEAGVLLNVYRSTADEVAFADSTLRSEIVFKGLSTEFVRLDRFIQKLSAEKANGFITMSTKNNQRIGTLSIREGEPVGLFVTPEAGPSSFFDRQALPALLEEMGRQGVVFDVYRSLVEPLPEEGEAGKQEQPALKAAESRSASEGAGEMAASEKGVAPAEKVAPDKGAGAKGAVDRRPGDGRADFMASLQGVFAKIEKFVDGACEKGTFLRVLQRVCIEKSELYPFLDPFEGQFTYQGGKIRVDHEVTVDDFAVAIADSLNLALSYLQKELPRNVMLPGGLKGEIESSFRGFADLLTRSGLQFVVPPTIR